MPTCKPGDLEPGKSSSLPKNKMDEVYQQAPPEWKEILELICTLLDKTNDMSDVIPGIDHDRIRYFVRQVLAHENRPDWMTEVIKTLGKHLIMPEIVHLLSEEEKTQMAEIKKI